MHAAYCINWIEYERGWGHRPDGHTLHASREIADAFKADHHSRQPAEVPHEYSVPGQPFLVEVDADTHAKVTAEGTIWGHPTRNLPPLSSRSGGLEK